MQINKFFMLIYNFLLTNKTKKNSTNKNYRVKYVFGPYKYTKF